MADSRVLVTDWKCIGRSGPTVDGRTIDVVVIEEMAASYDKSLFTALIWPEHQRWFNMGQVEQLRAVDNTEGGKDLYAILSPNSYYLTANEAGQKLFSSMEITPDFRKTGKAYLTGLGATDDPASVATSEIRLSTTAAVTGVLLSSVVEIVDKQFSDPVKLTMLERLANKFFHKPEEEIMALTKAEIEELNKGFAEVKALFANMKPPETKVELSTADQFKKLHERLDSLEQKFSAAAPVVENQVDDSSKALMAKIEALELKFAAALKEQPGTQTEEFTAAITDAEKKDIV